MWQAFMCVGAPTIICGVLMTFVLCAVARAPEPYDANTSRYKYDISLVYCMDGCKPCRELEAYMSKHGFPTATRYVTEPPAAIDFYPTVRYTDGFFDNGQRVKNGECRLPKKPVEVIHLTR